ncbi:MAG: polymer-forming cytoskeletal protein [Bacteroidota bacterium]
MMTSSKLTLPWDRLIVLFNTFRKSGTAQKSTSKAKSKNQKISDPQEKQSGSNGSKSMSLIADGTVIEGKVSFAQSARLDGKIIGEVLCEHKLVTGQKSNIQGTVKAENSTIEGMIEGELHVKQTVHLCGNAHVKGKIVAQKLKVDSGATLDGEFRIGKA